MRTVELTRLRCHRCLHSWTPVHSPVRICPRCKSTQWDVPKIHSFRSGNGLGVDDILTPHREAVLRVARKYGAEQLWVFGSVRRHEARPDSDVDLLVEWKPGGSPLARIDMENELATLLGREVQVATVEAIPWHFRDQVVAEAMRLPW